MTAPVAPRAEASQLLEGVNALIAALRACETRDAKVQLLCMVIVAAERRGRESAAAELASLGHNYGALLSAAGAQTERIEVLEAMLGDARKSLIQGVTGIFDGFTIHDSNKLIKRIDAALAASEVKS